MDTAGNIIPLENEEDVLDFLIRMFLWNHNRLPCEHDRLLLVRAAHVFKCLGDNCANPRLHGLEEELDQAPGGSFKSRSSEQLNLSYHCMDLCAKMYPELGPWS